MKIIDKKHKGHKEPLYLIIAIILLPFFGIAQTDSTVSNSYQTEFDNFNTQIQQDFHSFKSRNDSLFYTFLKQSWETYNLFVDQPNIYPKPNKQPVFTGNQKTQKKLIDSLMNTDSLKSYQLKYLSPEKYQKLKKTTNELGSNSFYGLPMPKIPQRPQVGGTEYPLLELKEESIAQRFKMYRQSENQTDFLEDLAQTKDTYALNDWAIIQLLNELSKAHFEQENDRLLWVWYMLLQNNFKVRLGFQGDDVFLLAHFSTAIYYQPYLQIEQEKYYVLSLNNDALPSASLKTYAQNHPKQLKAFNLLTTKLPHFKSTPQTHNIQYEETDMALSYDRSLTTFYQSYPSTELSVYLNMPLSELARKQIQNSLGNALKNKPQLAQINLLLHFVQYGFAYENDEQQFSKERYLFAEEMLYFTKGDCEDRVILLDKLIKEFTSLETIVLLYPGHVVLGIAIEQTIFGATINYHSKKYYLADPTYLGADLGIQMTEYKTIKPQILTVEKHTAL